MPTIMNILDKKGSYVANKDKTCSVLEATLEMNERHIGSVVVCSGNKVVGIFTERDILSRVVAARLDPARTMLEEVMTTPVACCLPETSVDECKGMMTEKRIRHLPVVADGKLLGIITSGDILALEKTKRQESIKYLKEYLYGPFPEPETA